MQTTAFARRLSEIVSTLQIQSFIKVVEAILFSEPNSNLQETKKRFSELAFAARAELETLKADQEMKQIRHLLGVDRAMDPNLLGRMITAVNSHGTTYEVRQNNEYFRLFVTLSSAFSALANLSRTVDTLLIQPR